jgi:hypothetical protein
MASQSSPSDGIGFTRRELIVAGSIGVLGGVVLGGAGCASPAATAPAPTTIPGNARVTTKNGGTKPVYVPQAGANDPVSLSLADNLFWTDILTEHALFFTLLMPGDDLAQPRQQAQDFQRRFASQFARIQQGGMDSGNYVSLNRSTIELARPFIDFKHRMREQQVAGRLNSLVWPLFFEHTAREAERFVSRLEKFSRGQTEEDRTEVIDFWALIMAEHADFIAHLLDPEERQLVQQAFDSSRKFRDLRRQPATPAARQAAEEIINFKTAAEKGIQTGQIKSIINPALADHVRREAVKFADELQRIA